MTAAELAAIRSHVGTAVPPTDTMLQVAFERLGTVDAVALEVVRGRLADLLARPVKFTADGDFSEDYSANVAVLERQAAELSAAVTAPAAEAAHVMTVSRIRRKAYCR